MLKGHVFENQLFGNPIFAVFVNTFLAGENGVINGFGNSMAVTTSGFNLTIQSGVVCIQGRFLQEDTNSTITAGSTPAYARLVVEIDLDKTNTENDFQQGYYKIITNSSNYPDLTQTDIVNNVSGVYQFSLGRFQITSNGITGYADERAFLDFTSIYGEISEHIGAIDDEKIFLPIGGGCDYYGSELPNENYMWADGSAISRSEYAGLFAVIGTTYGAGDGSATFNLPDKRGRVAEMVNGDTNLGDKLGSKTHKHLLPFIVDSNPNWTKFQWNTGFGYGDITKTSANTNNINNTANANAFTGKQLYNEPVSSRQPTLVCNYIIKVK